jgi:hypothetical protein
MLLDQQLLRCIAASVSFLAGAPKTVSIGSKFGPPGVIVAVAWLMADAIEPGGECYLLYLDQEGDKKVELLKRQLEERYKKLEPDARIPWNELSYTPASATRLYCEMADPDTAVVGTRIP